MKRTHLDLVGACPSAQQPVRTGWNGSQTLFIKQIPGDRGYDEHNHRHHHLFVNAHPGLGGAAVVHFAHHGHLNLLRVIVKVTH
jgi:hypothetical protein